MSRVAELREPAEDVPSLVEVRRVVAAFVLATRPVVSGCRIIIDLPGGLADTLAVPLAAEPDDLEGRVLAILGKMRPGEWMKGRSIAAELDMEYEGGHLKGTLARMARAGDIESSKAYGYRLPKG